jgi:hypothetical protein
LALGRLQVRLMASRSGLEAVIESAPRLSGSRPKISLSAFSYRTLMPAPRLKFSEVMGSELSSPRGSHVNR